MKFFLLLFFLAPGIATGVSAGVLDDPLIRSVMEDVESVELVIGELTPVDVNDLSRISIVDPEVADIVETNEDNILLVGRTEGRTTLFIWDAAGKRVVNIFVAQENLEDIRDRIEKLLQKADVKGVELSADPVEGKVVISGVVDTADMLRFENVVFPFIDTNAAMSLVKEGETEEMVQIDMQLTEVSSTLFRNIGVEWHSGEVSASSFASDFAESLPNFDSGADLLNVGRFARSQALIVRINALVTEGDAKILSRPKVVVASGEEASFLVGGEIPIKLKTTNENGVTEGIQFKQYGIGLTLTPTIRADDKIDIILYVDISDIDRANAVEDNVAYTLRSAQTRLLVDNGETVVLAGLIKNTEGETRRKVPYLSNIPVLGMLFRSKQTPTADSDTEIVISLTPNLLKNQSTEKDSRPEAAGPTVASGNETTQPIQNFQPSKDDINEYISQIQRLIAASLVYPQEAKELGWEGMVKVNLMILGDGTLAYAVLSETSGYDMLDQAALSLIKNLAYPSLPSSLRSQELNMTVPIVYKNN